MSQVNYCPNDAEHLPPSSRRLTWRRGITRCRASYFLAFRFPATFFFGAFRLAGAPFSAILFAAAFFFGGLAKSLLTVSSL